MKSLLISAIEEVIFPFEEMLKNYLESDEIEHILKELRVFEITLITFIHTEQKKVKELFEDFRKIYKLGLENDKIKGLIVFFYGLLTMFLIENDIDLDKFKLLHEHFKTIFKNEDDFLDLSEDNNITHPNNTISAKEFLENEEVDFELIEEIKDLIENYFLITSKYETITDDYIEEVKYIIEKLETLFELSGEFSNLSKAFDELFNLLSSKNINNDILKTFLDYLIEDLEKWINVIFIEKSAIDIHYLDANFIATVAQIHKIIGGGER